MDLAKLLAFLLMVADHANAYLLAGAYPWVWQAGRVVFPLFALALGIGLFGRAEHALSVAKRLGVLAVVAELAAWPLLEAGVRLPYLNVCFTLAGGALLVYASSLSGWRQWACVALVVAVTWFSEYGFLGAAMVWAQAGGVRRLGWLLATVAGICLFQGTPAPALALFIMDALLRHQSAPGWRTPRLLFGALYVLQFVAFGALL